MLKNKTVQEIKIFIDSMSNEEFLKNISSFEDNRKSIQSIIQTRLNKIKKEVAEIKRIDGMISFDLSFNKKFVAGVDEVGRGPLAGPVIAACVVMDYSKKILGINDSKKLSKEKREHLYNQIIENSLYCSIGEVNNEVIDKKNILNSTFISMNAAIDFVSKEMSDKKENIDIILVDGNQKIKNQNIYQETIIKGDSKSYAIACASIIAKVYRDKIMEKYSKKYPYYHFEKNSGYGTKEHLEGIKKHGLCPIHRRTFCSNI